VTIGFSPFLSMQMKTDKTGPVVLFFGLIAHLSSARFVFLKGEERGRQRKNTHYTENNGLKIDRCSRRLLRNNTRTDTCAVLISLWRLHRLALSLWYLKPLSLSPGWIGFSTKETARSFLFYQIEFVRLVQKRRVQDKERGGGGEVIPSPLWAAPPQ
jgi:hypothetical protein